MDIHFGSMDGTTDRSASPADSGSESQIATPLHLQRLERALRVDLLMRQVRSFVAGDSELVSDEMLVPINKQQMRSIKTKAYNLSKVKKSKKWLKNALIEKSSSESSEPEEQTDDDDGDESADEQMVQQMIKFQNFKRKVRKDFMNSFDCPGSVPPALKSFKSYSSSLVSSALAQSFVTPAEPPVRLTGKTVSDPKSKKSRSAVKSATKRKKADVDCENTTVSVSKIVPTSAQSESPITLLPSESTSIPDTMSVSTTLSTPPLPASLTLSVSDSVDSIKKFKLEKMLDEIPYDMTLPDEILQTESSDAAPSPSTVPTDEIVYSTLLPDEIFEESSNSLLSQTLSSPSSVAVPPASSHKSATAPPTPTGLSGSASLKKSHHHLTKWKPIRKTNQSPVVAAVATSAPTSVQPQSPESSVSAKRKRVWTAVVKCIPKTQEQVMKERKDGLANCRRLSSWCREEHRNILKRWSLLLTDDPIHDLRRQMLAFWEIPLPPLDSEPEDDPEVVMESVSQLFHVHDFL